MPFIFRKNLLILFFVPITITLSAQNIEKLDTTRIYDIPEIIITESYNNSEIRSTAPLQILSNSELKKLNVLQVSDAVKHFSGVTVKDYGGIGGLKTVSVRSLGSNHTGVLYDGIAVSDVQSGQIDIGRFSLDNIEGISLVNGQGDNIYQTARAFSSASVLIIKTNPPAFREGRNINGKVSLKGGSFGLINPSVRLEGKINSKFSGVFSGEYLGSNGEYPYKLRHGYNKNDSVSSEKRKNTDVKNFRLEGALYGSFTEKQNAYIKAYYYQSERGLPGAVINSNPNQNSHQRIWDKTFFTQAHYQNDISRLLFFQINGKYNWAWTHYVDNGLSKTNNTYSQNEYYLSASLLYRALRNLSFSFATDGIINSLDSDARNFVYPQRYTLLSVLAVKYVNNNLLATASLLSTNTKETVKSGESADNYNKLSPYIGFSYQPFSSVDLRFRAFYKNIFRLPTFNDLYYENSGNRILKPENTDQLNVGITYGTSFLNKWNLQIMVDGYHNKVTDKIVTYPSRQLFVWTTFNVDKVDINGIDFNGDISYQVNENWSFSLGSSYTYQRALNTTYPDNRYTYKHQIPYTPRICGSGKAGIETKWVNINYSLVWSGHVYSSTQNYSSNRLDGYQDHSISASRDFNFLFGKISANIELLNLGNKNYQIVKSYPMPGRSFRATVAVVF